MTDGPMPSDHLRGCPEHGVVDKTEDGERWCPCCELGTESRPSAVSDVQFDGTDRRWNIGQDTMKGLLPALEKDAEREGVGPVYVAVAEITRNHLPAGYTPQERWWNVVVAETGNTSREVIKHVADAKEITEKIQGGGEYLEASEPAHALLNGEQWDPVLAPYCPTVSYTRADSETLHIKMSGFRSDSAYKNARRDIGKIAEGSDLFVRTINAGGSHEGAKVEVSTSDD